MAISDDKRMLYNILNQRLRSVSFSYETTSLVFENDWVLAIFNKNSMFKDDQKLNAKEFILFKGEILIDIVAKDCQLRLHFSKDYFLDIDLSDKGYTGPEALQLVGPDNQIFVWN